MNFSGWLLAAALCSGALAQTTHEDVLRNLRFRSIGPAVMGGRIDDFAVVEADPRIIYAGTAAGGILKSVNGGTTWQPIFDNQPTASIGDIALAPSNPSILYVGMGEANNRQSSSWGDGVYKSTDAGATWTNVGLKKTRHIGRVVIDPGNPEVVYVAALGDLWNANPERGVFKTTDGGANWTEVLTIDNDTGVSDLAMDPQSPNILYAAAYTRRRTAFGYSGGGPLGGIYRTTDSGGHWQKMTRGLPVTGDIGRCAVDVYRKNPNIVYALVEHLRQGGVYRSEDKGLTWVKMSAINPRPSYYSQVRIDPNSDTRLWVLGAPLYFSEDGGRTFTQARGNGIHTDYHGFWIDSANSDHVIAGSDGGITISWDAGRTWDYVNNFPIGQFYEVTYDFERPYHVCGGLQDNNTWCGPSATVTARGTTNGDWIQINGGDGFHARIDPKDPHTVYSESQDGNLSRRDLATGLTKSIRPEEDSVTAPRYRFQWNSPVIISARDNHTLYYGGNYLFKSTDRGDTWVRLGDKDLTNNQDRYTMPILGKVVDKNTLSRNDGVENWPSITAIAESPANPTVLWAGTDDGNLQVSRDGGATWANVASKVPGLKQPAYVSRIEAAYQEPGSAIVAFDNHRSGDFGVYIFVTKDYGQSWTRITDGIPEAAGTVHAVREDPQNSNLLFAGTEFGLYVSFNRGQQWERMRNGLPTVPVFDLQIHPRDHALIVATHGRSIWVMDNITPLEEMNDAVMTSEVKLFTPLPGVEWRQGNYLGFTGSKEFVAPNPPAGVALEYFVKTTGPVQVTIADQAGKTVRTLGGRGAGGQLNVMAWDMRGENPLQAAGRGGRGGGGGGGAGGGFGGRGGAPLVDAGDYVVSIAAAGKTDQKTVRIEDDPRASISTADRDKRRATMDRLISMLREADAARRKVVATQTALTSLTASWKRPGITPPPEAVQKAAAELLAKVQKAAPTFETPPSDEPPILGFAGPPIAYRPATVLQQIQRLMGAIGVYPAAPSAIQLRDVDQAAAELREGIAQVTAMDGETARLNQTMAEAGVPYLVIDTQSVPPAGGRGGGER